MLLPRCFSWGRNLQLSLHLAIAQCDAYVLADAPDLLSPAVLLSIATTNIVSVHWLPCKVQLVVPSYGLPVSWTG